MEVTTSRYTVRVIPYSHEEDDAIVPMWRARAEWGWFGYIATRRWRRVAMAEAVIGLVAYRLKRETQRRLVRLLNGRAA